MRITYQSRFILRLVLLVFVLWSGFCSADQIPDQYDSEFKEATKRYLPGVDWRLLKAQCYQESLLKKDAVSPVGAKGLCQFMPSTWENVSKELDFPDGASAYAPELSIQAAAYYTAKMRSIWHENRPEIDRLSLAFASYNAGPGNIIKSQKLCGGSKFYNEIIWCLPCVTGQNAHETRTYVKKIWGYWLRMFLGKY